MIEAIIKEGGTTRVFANRAKLEVSLQGGGTTFFVPESETRLTTKRIEKNGVYKASDDGDYGWSTVTVAVSTTDSVTGTGPDGKEHNYSVDGSGALVDQVVPSEIRITTPPNYVGPYGDGAILSFDGIVVHAYDALGNDMGEVPFNELVFPVTVARYDAEAGPINEYRASDLDLGDLTSPVPSASLCVVEAGDGRSITHEMQGSGSGRATGWIESNGKYYVLGASPIATDTLGQADLPNSVTYDGKTVYYGGVSGSFIAGVAENIDPDAGYGETVNTNHVDRGNVAWTIIYGTLTGTSGGVQIPVEWSRTGDGLVLATSFGVSVVPGPSGGDD